MERTPCILCGSDTPERVLEAPDRYVRASREEFTLVRCTACGLIYVNPRPTQEEMARYYPEDYPPYAAGYEIFSRNRLFDALSAIKRRIAPKKRASDAAQDARAADDSVKTVLDFGCGGGRFLKRLRREHPRWRLHGFDIAANTRVQEADGVTLYLGRSEDLLARFAPGTFDTIYFNNVLEHLPNPLHTLSAMTALLKEDGCIMIEVPNIGSVKFRVFGKYFSSLDLPRHLYHFDETTLARLCEESGLAVDSLRKTGSAKSTVRSIYFALGIKKDGLDPLFYSLAGALTSLIGARRIDDDVLQVTASKRRHPADVRRAS